MGRKSSLTTEQWIEIERRHLVDGESVNSLAKEFGINEAAVRRKINPNKSEGKAQSNPLISLANQKAKAERELRNISEQISELPVARQQIVSDLARKLTNISNHLGSAAEYGAATAHRLSALAHGEVQKVDDVDPGKCMETLKGVAVLTKMANESSEIGLNLLRANKEAADEANKGKHLVSAGLTHFYGESDDKTDA